VDSVETHFIKIRGEKIMQALKNVELIIVGLFILYVKLLLLKSPFCKPYVYLLSRELNYLKYVLLSINKLHELSILDKVSTSSSYN